MKCPRCSQRAKWIGQYKIKKLPGKRVVYFRCRHCDLRFQEKRWLSVPSVQRAPVDNPDR